jgi:glycosyltransferase involved in cell wall biosynthesis
MRIGIDARELCGRPTGVGRYLHGLLTEWARDDQARRHEFVLFAHEPIPVDFDAHRFPQRIVSGRGDTWWEQGRLPRALAGDHLDVLFSPGYTAPLFARIPSVVAIHDLSFAAHPEWFSMREGMRRRWLARRAASNARAVITISQFSRRELIDRFGVAPANVHVIPPGVTPPLLPSEPRSPGPRVLYVGSIFARRRVVDLIQAFAPIARRRPDAALDLVGDDRSYPRIDVRQAIANEGLERHARWHEYVGEDHLARLYADARVFAFLSEYEGLGLTPLEALAAGVPSVLLDTEVARESCGDAALYVARGEIAATTQALERLLFDDPLRTRLLSAGSQVLSRYSWPLAARQTLRVFESAA